MPLENPKSNISDWYSELILRAHIVDSRTPVKGANVLMHQGHFIWDKIRLYLDELFEETDHKSMYFPMFIPEDFLNRESDHFAGFTPEVAWVTHVGDTELARKVALRPTSETIMYHMFSQWINSHADLPFKVKQWCNIVRWDTKMTRPLLRDREFLWSEAHTAHADQEDADRQMKESIRLYTSLFDALKLSYLVVKRPDHDKFAGADYTIAFDSPMPNGKVLQIGTTHMLGQNFSKPFDVKYQDENGETKYVYQLSYGLTTRLLAALIFMQGDDQGLVIPPFFAPKQIVIVPIVRKGKEEIVMAACNEVYKKLKKKGYRVVLDDREQYTSGWKFSEWEMLGVPVRVEIGPRDVEKGVVTLVRRGSREKTAVNNEDVVKAIPKKFKELEDFMDAVSKKMYDDAFYKADDFDELVKIFNDNRGIVQVNWCEKLACAEKIKEATTAEVRGARIDKQEKVTGPCIACGKKAKSLVYVASAY